MTPAAQQLIVNVIRQHGIAVADDAKLLQALLKDKARGQYKQEIFLCISSLQANVVARLQNLNNAPSATVAVQLINTLHNDYAFDLKKARWMIDTWLLVFNLPPLPVASSPSQQQPALLAPMQTRLKWRWLAAMLIVFLTVGSAGLAIRSQNIKQPLPTAPATQPAAIPNSAQQTITAPAVTPVIAKETDTSLAAIEPEMVAIPAGSFTMGCVPERDEVEGGCEDNEKPPHRVTVAGFYLSKTEVTFEQWDACEAAKQCPHANDEGWGRGTRPVIDVSWQDAQVYIKWLNSQTGKTYRLPTEAEWEYAARGGHNDRAFPWGNAANHDYANYDGKSGKDQWEYTAPVAQFPANDYGLNDMIGNVWEWTCSEYKDNYSADSNEQPCASTGSSRVVRGGSWYYRGRYVRSACRYGYTPVNRNSLLGFRLALGLELRPGQSGR